MNNIVETKARSLAKTIIWRMVAMLITWSILYYFTGELSESIKITLVATIFGMIAYYIHERIWNSIKWGKKIL